MNLTSRMNLGGPTLTPEGETLSYRSTYYLIKGWNFLKRYKGQPLYVVNYLRFFWQPSYREPVRFLDDEEYLAKAKEKSTIRLGEGEFTLMLGTRDIVVQKFDPALRDFFFTVAREYNDDSPYLLAMPSHLNISNAELERHDARYLWMPGKILFRLFFNRSAWYSDASFFYRDGTTDKFLKVISDDKDIVYVTNAQNIGNLKNIEGTLTPRARSVSYVETPPASTFALRDQVLAGIEKVIANKEAAVVVFACGPAGKVLGRILALKGVMAHDIGSGIAFLFDSQSHEKDINWPIFGPLFIKNRDYDRQAL